LRGETGPFPHALQHKTFEQSSLRFWIRAQALILRLGHDRWIEADIALPLDEVVEFALIPDLDRLSVLTGNKCTVLLLGDRNDGLARQIAPQDQHVHAVELGAIDEFLEADIRAVQVRGEEDLHLRVGTLVLLAPKHSRTLAQNFVRYSSISH